MITKEERNAMFMRIDSSEFICDTTKLRAKSLVDFIRFNYPLAPRPALGDDEIDSIVMEWFSPGNRKITLYVSHDQVTFLKIDGQHIEDEKVFSPNICYELFTWLYQ